MNETPEFTENSEVCQHWKNLCKECKDRLFIMDRHQCPYCKISWKEPLNKMFMRPRVIKAFLRAIESSYTSYTEEEADEEAKTRVKETLHEIPYETIVNHFRPDINISEEVYTHFVDMMDNEANSIIEALVRDVDRLGLDMIEMNSRGHYLGSDEQEIEIQIFGEKFFVYKN